MPGGPMLAALERFRLPVDFLAMINDIYDSRTFFVSDNCRDSTTKSQSVGISQGCPLSQFLFAIVMSVIITESIAIHLDTNSVQSLPGFDSMIVTCAIQSGSTPKKPKFKHSDETRAIAVRRCNCRDRDERKTIIIIIDA